MRGILRPVMDSDGNGKNQNGRRHDNDNREANSIPHSPTPGRGTLAIRLTPDPARNSAGHSIGD